jgi:polysaccharide biosynthesis protein, putative transporter
VRTFHVTDVRREFDFPIYLATRILTVAAMIAGIVVYSLFSGGLSTSVGLVIAIALLRVFDAYEDVFYSEFQREGRLDLGARASFWRIFTTMAVFCLLVVLTDSLFIASLVSLAASVVALVVAFYPGARASFGITPAWNWAAIKRLLIECAPLFLASFTAMYLSNAPRYGIKYFMDFTAQGYFAIIYMPAVAINMLSLLVFRPLLTRMATYWVENNWSGFSAIVRRGLLATVGAFAAVALATVTIGVPILNLFFGQDISGYRLELVVLVGGGALNAAAVILYYALTTMRLQRAVFWGYAAAAVVITVLVVVAIPPLGLLGASLAYLGAMATTVICFWLTMQLRRPKEN